MNGYLGIDVGSVSTNLVVIDDNLQVRDALYLRTRGQPISAVQQGMGMLEERLDNSMSLVGAGTTGSARYLASVITGADIVKNEITAHAIAASTMVPDVQTVLEIGGQDSKIIIIRDGVVVDFAMNTVCAAGTGSFLDQQAGRLNIPIEEFGDFALQAKTPVRIAGRCAVFAESDMIHKQQEGHAMEDIIAGLCQALVRNYLNNVGKGKEIASPVVFQGGVAANTGMRQAFSQALRLEVIVPEHFNVMGAVGAALLARQAVAGGKKTRFAGLQIARLDFHSSSFLCHGCANQCEVIQICRGEHVLARWGDRCGKWEQSVSA